MFLSLWKEGMAVKGLNVFYKRLWIFVKLREVLKYITWRVAEKMSGGQDARMLLI